METTLSCDHDTNNDCRESRPDGIAAHDLAKSEANANDGENSSNNGHLINSFLFLFDSNIIFFIVLNMLINHFHDKHTSTNDCNHQSNNQFPVSTEWVFRFNLILHWNSPWLCL